MDCVCFENKNMGIYFIADPDGYWVEIVLINKVNYNIYNGLSKPVLSRARCLELVRLLDGRKGFRFPWGGGVTVRGSSSLVSWER